MSLQEHTVPRQRNRNAGSIPGGDGNVQVGPALHFFRSTSQNESQIRPRLCPEGIELKDVPCAVVLVFFATFSLEARLLARWSTTASRRTGCAYPELAPINHNQIHAGARFFRAPGPFFFHGICISYIPADGRKKQQCSEDCKQRFARVANEPQLMRPH